MAIIPDQVQQIAIYLQAIASVGVVIFTLAAATMECLNRFQCPDDRVKTRDWWTDRWLLISDTGWFQLPYWVLGKFGYGFNSFSQKFYRFFNSDTAASPKLVGLTAIAMLLAAIIATPLVLWQYMGWLSLVYLGVGGVLFNIQQHRPILEIAFGIWIIITIIAIPLLIFHFLPLLSLPKAFAVLLLVSPLMWLCLTFIGTSCFVAKGLYHASRDQTDEPQFMGSPYVETWALATTLSFIASMAALLIGSVFNQKINASPSLLLFITNAICDTFSLAMLLFAIQWTLSKPTATRLISGMVATIVISGILALLSVWIGLANSHRPLLLTECLQILIGQDPSAGTIYLGSIFWIMHTVFIPLLLLYLILTILMLSKGLLHISHWLFGKAAVNDNPHHMLAGIFLLLAALCLVAQSIGKSFL